MGIFDRIADQLGDLIVPDDVKIRVDLGAALLERGEFERAMKELREALALRPDHPRAAWLLGLACARSGDLVAAEEALSQAVAGRDDFAEAWVALGEVRRRRGRIEGAAEAFRKALEVGLDGGELRGEAYRGLGSAWLALGRFDKAVRELRKAAAELPGDLESHALLGRALLSRGDLDGARLCLERATAAAEPASSTTAGETREGASAVAALCALGEIYLRLGRLHDAESAYVRALAVGATARRPRWSPAGAPPESSPPSESSPSPETKASPERSPSIDGWLIDARLGLANTRLAAGDAAGAHGHALQALAEAPRLAAAHLTVGRALALGHSDEAALGAIDRALVLADLDEAPRILEEALKIALRAGLADAARAASYADRLLADAENNGAAPPPDALAAVALAKLTAGDGVGAAETIAGALGRETLEVRLAQARIHLAAAHPAAAGTVLRRAIELAPADARPRALLAEVYRAGRERPPADLAGLLRAAHRLLLSVGEFGDLAPAAARVLDLVDSPLLVTVMGEFNSGKSTFVNALVGEEVAPMGITPTTATINVLKFGAERGGRVVYLDDTTRDVPWDEVPALLKGLDEAEAKRIRWVEVLFPLETLQRVNVVDTPGLNSILPEHEETARAFVAQADAILWLFSVGQAGKSSEREALERIRAEKKKALGVVNKIDRTDEAGLREILAHLQSGFGDLVEALVPFSARDALLGRQQGDAARLAKSNRAELDRVLEERFFKRAKSIKRAAAVRRIGALLDEAARRGHAAIDGEPGDLEGRRTAIDGALASVRADQAIWQRRFLGEERLRLVEELDAVYEAGAREVLDFVRPRRWPFGSNRAAPADRDFLLGLVEEKLSGLGENSRARVVEAARRAAASLRAVDESYSIAEPIRILDEQVYGRHRAFVRGYLRGGRVDDFFTRVLPKLELGEAEIRKALEREMPNLEIVDDELLAPLRAWTERLFDGLLGRLKRAADVEELRRYDLEERLIAPIETLREALATVEKHG